MSRTKFLSLFLESPRQVGSFVPSSRYLGRKMVRMSGIHEANCILEFGSGTGAVTKEIIKACNKECQIHAFELESTFLPYLEKLHAPNLHIIPDDVRNASLYVPEGSVDIIFSCLPFGSFDNELVHEILSEAKKMLRPGGKFVQFQYFLSDKKKIACHFEVCNIGWEWRNFPPAFVYVANKPKE